MALGSGEVTISHGQVIGAVRTVVVKAEWAGSVVAHHSRHCGRLLQPDCGAFCALPKRRWLAEAFRARSGKEEGRGMHYFGLKPARASG